MLGTLALVGAGVSAGASLFGGLKNLFTARAENDRKERERLENQAWYDKRYNEDMTQRADAQRLLSLTEEKLKARNKAAEGQASVMGASEESAAAAKEANNKAISDTVSAINAQGDARKERIEDQYLARKRGINNDISALNQQKMASTANAIAGVGSAMGNLAALDALDKNQIGG